MNKKPLSIVECKNCKYFQYKYIDKYSCLYSCKLNKECFKLDNPTVNIDRVCFKDKGIFSKKEKTSNGKNNT